MKSDRKFRPEPGGGRTLPPDWRPDRVEARRLLIAADGVDAFRAVVGPPPHERLVGAGRRRVIHTHGHHPGIGEDDRDVAAIGCRLVDDLTRDGLDGDDRVRSDPNVDRSATGRARHELVLVLGSRENAQAPVDVRLVGTVDHLSRIAVARPRAAGVGSGDERNEPAIGATPVVGCVEQPHVEHAVVPLAFLGDVDRDLRELRFVVQVATGLRSSPGSGSLTSGQATAVATGVAGGLRGGGSGRLRRSGRLTTGVTGGLRRHGRTIVIVIRDVVPVVEQPDEQDNDGDCGQHPEQDRGDQHRVAVIVCGAAVNHAVAAALEDDAIIIIVFDVDGFAITGIAAAAEGTRLAVAAAALATRGRLGAGGSQ